MSMRPIDLQTVVPRVPETARVERLGQQVQEKGAAEVARLGQEAARRGRERVAAPEEAEQGRVSERKGGGDGGGRGRKGRPPAREEIPDAERSPAAPAEAEPGRHLDIKI